MKLGDFAHFLCSSPLVPWCRLQDLGPSHQCQSLLQGRFRHLPKLFVKRLCLNAAAAAVAAATAAGQFSIIDRAMGYAASSQRRRSGLVRIGHVGRRDPGHGKFCRCCVDVAFAGLQHEVLLLRARQRDRCWCFSPSSDSHWGALCWPQVAGKTEVRQAEAVATEQASRTTSRAAAPLWSLRKPSCLQGHLNAALQALVQ